MVQQFKKMRRFVLAAGVFLILLGIALTVNSQYHAFFQSIRAFNGIELQAPRSEVLYRLGIPNYVLGEPEYDSTFEGYMQPVYELDASSKDPNALPNGKSYKDFQEWMYSEANGISRLTIQIDSTNHVKSLEWFHSECNQTAWGPVAGVRCGDDESVVMNLGKPSTVSVKDVSKTVKYADIGVTFTLTKGKVYMVRTHAVKLSKWVVFKRFLWSRF